MNVTNTASTSSNGPTTASSITTQLSDQSSDRNNNANENVNRRPSAPPRSPPVGAARSIVAKDLPPGAAPLGSIPRPNVPPQPHSVPHSPSTSISAVSSSSVPLLASQLGRPVNLGNHHHHPHHLPVTASAAAAAAAAAALASGMPPLSPHHLNLLSHTLSPFAAIPTGNGKIMARNINGTLAVTSHPSNESELQIYRVLQRANLLSYYDTFIAQGGDDVQQLCEAGEAEFLEIMDLVGMASKPMHVRRLQKALQEWAQNPGLFQTPLVPLSTLTTPSAAAAVIRASSSGGPGISVPSTSVPPSLPPVGSRPVNNDHMLSTASTGPMVSASATSSAIAASRRSVSPPTSSSSMQPLVFSEKSTSSAPHSPSPNLISKDNQNSHQSVPSPTYSQSGQDYPPLSSSPLQLTPTLVESQIQRIADTAENLIKAMSETVEAKQIKNNKKVSKEVEMVLAMSNDDPRKMEEIRRFSAIYGRFDCKRKPEKPLTLHEVSVNEAAAQLCLKKPILLMRRDELFPLARQVVRDSGYQYSKGHSRSQFQAGYPSKIFGLGGAGGSSAKSGDDENSRDSSNGGDSQQPQAKKRGRYSDSEPDGHSLVKKERFERISDELRQLGDRMEELKNAATQARDANDVNALHAIGQQMEMIKLRENRLLQEHQHFRPRVHGRVSTSSDPERPDTDDDSQLSYSNTSSPNNVHHAGSYVLSASGGQIIAVQNPALSMSGTLPTLRASSTSPTSASTLVTGGGTPSSTAAAVSDSKNLVNLLNLSRRSGLNPAAAAAAAAAVAAAAQHSGNGKDHNAKQKQPTTIIHSDDEEMTFKEEPASPPPPPSLLQPRNSPPRANGK